MSATTIAAKHPIRVGCSCWTYEDWKGPLYPHGLKSDEMLSYYADRFTIVEADGTFYRTPTRAQTENWARLTPKEFRFSLKVPRRITHEKKLKDCGEEIAEFARGVEPLGDRLHCALLQFGYFNQSAFGSLESFLDRLNDFLELWPMNRIPLAVEIRNPRWMVAPFADTLRRHGAALALTDQAWMPRPVEIIERFDPLTGPFAYIRLLGDRESMEKLTSVWDKIVVDRSRELAETADIALDLADRAPTSIIVSNVFAGYSPGTAQALRSVIGLPEPKPPQRARAMLFDFD